MLCVAVGFLGYFWYSSRNPEREVLDAAARAQAEGKFVRLTDGVTHYKLSGPDSGVPAVLVHGFSVPSYIMDSIAVALSGEGYRVLQYDVFGRGYSDRPDVTYDAELVDRQLGEIMDSTGIRGPVHLMGLSYGGFITGTFAGRHPDRVRSLTLFDPAAGESSPPPWYIRAPLLGPFLWQALVVPGMDDGQLEDFVNPEPWPDWLDRYRVQMKYKGFGRALRSTALFDGSVSMDSVYRTVGEKSFPVALFWGIEDKVVPIKEADGLKRAIPRIEFHAIERAGHLPHMERADTVNPLLIRFVRNADSSAVSREP